MGVAWQGQVGQGSLPACGNRSLQSSACLIRAGQLQSPALTVMPMSLWISASHAICSAFTPTNDPTPATTSSRQRTERDDDAKRPTPEGRPVGHSGQGERLSGLPTQPARLEGKRSTKGRRRQVKIKPTSNRERNEKQKEKSESRVLFWKSLDVSSATSSLLSLFATRQSTMVRICRHVSSSVCNPTHPIFMVCAWLGPFLFVLETANNTHIKRRRESTNPKECSIDSPM